MGADRRRPPMGGAGHGDLGRRSHSDLDGATASGTLVATGGGYHGLSQTAGRGSYRSFEYTEARQGPFCKLAARQQAIEALVQRYTGAGLLTLTDRETVRERHGRKYGARPAKTRTVRSVQVIG